MSVYTIEDNKIHFSQDALNVVYQRVLSILMKLRKYPVSTFASLLAVLYPFLNYYGYSFATLSFFLALLLFAYAIKKRGCIAIVQPAAMICYVLYYCATRFFLNTDSLRGIIAPCIIFVFIFLLGGFLNKEVLLNRFLKIYRIAVFVNIAFLFLQEGLYLATGYRVLGILTFLPLTNIGGSDFDAGQYAETAAMTERSSAFFSEPAHFVQFLLPLLAVELFFVRSKMAYLRSCLYVVALFVLASGNALLGMGIIGIFLFFFVLRRLHPLLSIATLIFTISMVVISVNAAMKTEYGEKLMERVEELDPDQNRISSGFVRIFRGYYIWNEMDMKEKIVGLNSSVKINEKIGSSIMAFTFKDDDRYMNTVQSIMIYTGYIGALMYIGLLVYLWRGNNWAGRCCIAIYVGISFIASVYFTYTMLLYLLVAFLMKKENSTLKTKALIWKFA